MKTILEYLTDLECHNQREWYHLNKQRHHQANAQFEQLLQSLIIEIGKTDPSIAMNIPGDLTFKMVRDTRFSADKSPYNPTMRAHIAPKGKLPVPVGYYIAIRPQGRSFLGGGLFADMFKDATALIRDYIVQNGERWQAVITAPSFTQYFTVKGSALKNVPSGYDKAHPQAQYLKNKSWYVEYRLKDEQLLDKGFVLDATQIYQAMQPFNAFLNDALQGFEMPKRM